MSHADLGWHSDSATFQLCDFGQLQFSEHYFSHWWIKCVKSFKRGSQAFNEVESIQYWCQGGALSVWTIVTPQINPGVYSVCQFPWCKYPDLDQYQAISISLNAGLERDLGYTRQHFHYPDPVKIRCNIQYNIGGGCCLFSLGMCCLCF